MTKSYIDITTDLSQELANLRKNIPETSKAFTQLASAAMAEGALSKKHKELIALAIGVAKQCDGCIGFHTKALVKLGATEEEINETLAISIYMGGGPALMYAADAYKSFMEFKNLASEAA